MSLLRLVTKKNLKKMVYGFSCPSSASRLVSSLFRVPRRRLVSPSRRLFSLPVQRDGVVCPPVVCSARPCSFGHRLHAQRLFLRSSCFCGWLAFCTGVFPGSQVVVCHPQHLVCRCINPSRVGFLGEKALPQLHL